MNRYEELMQIFCSDNYRSRYLSAKNAHRCIICDKSIKNDINPSDRLEYSISALCSDCVKAPKIKSPEVAGKISNEI